MNTTEPADIVIFGASGDLTRRKLIPALHTLNCAGLLHPETRLIGFARTPLAPDVFRSDLFEGVESYARLKPNHDEICARWPEFAGRIDYLAGPYEDASHYRQIAGMIGDRNALFYLATPPALFPMIIERIGEAGLNRCDRGWRRIIIEKPFGRNMESARNLNALVRHYFIESQVFRIDHYLGKETVQNILTFRFANAIFEPLWSRNYIDHVQVVVAESIGVEHRASYYEQAGVLRDMVQNHLFQLMTLMAMEPPVVLNDRSLRDEKVKVLQAVRPLNAENCLLGQYRGYREEPDIPPDSNTPTLAVLRIYIDNWRWQGVPFYLMTGKGLKRRATEISLVFKRVPHLLFSRSRLSPNHISLCIQPDEGIHLWFESKVPGAGMTSVPVDMVFSYSDHFESQVLPDAYERLLVDAIHGDASLFARGDEIELSWQILDPLISDIEVKKIPVLSYEKESWGPREADMFLARDFRTWHLDCRREEPLHRREQPP
ncbi:MAG TPA: glucose-6-phosphate dehydrogenase [Syntrophales bacterium]|nr:glucose-6-phosphate dehydrogenase [Syntrophales bacterium]